MNCAPFVCLLVTDEHKVALFGVFDGHGGKQAAVYASRHLHTHLQTALRQPGIASPADEGPDAAADSSNAGDAAAEAAELRIQVQTLGAAPEDLAACDDADSVAAALPLALVAAFAATEQAFINHSQVRTAARSLAAAPEQCPGQRHAVMRVARQRNIAAHTCMPVFMSCRSRAQQPRWLRWSAGRWLLPVWVTRWPTWTPAPRSSR